MKRGIYPPLPAKGRGKFKYYGMAVMSFLFFLLFYKFIAGYLFSGQNNLEKDVITPYGGIGTGELAEFTQTGQETCGHAVLAFFLTSIGNPRTEAAIVKLFGSGSMLSLYDLETVFISYGFKTQLLKLDPEYFRSHPQPAILHFSARHFVVFLGEEGGEPVIFDPAYGKVYLPWAVLSRLFSGYMLYVYNE
jgi:hypothetical protein